MSHSPFVTNQLLFAAVANNYKMAGA